MFLRAFVLILISFSFISCSKGPLNSSNHQDNMEKLDKIYGKCKNPHRQYKALERKVCEDKQRAAGPDGVVGDPIDITEIIDRVRGVGGNTIAVSDTNNQLWDASLQVLNGFSLKITDYDGGYIETNWINSSNLPDQRCLIKSHITSQELISTGVKVKIICEKLINDEWYLSSESFVNDEKKLTLKILETAQTLANT
jgi:hypothetical protein